ncbi:molybdopterin-dependent oxidoreductase [Embleya sp. NPDC020630]|uniref:molybdopterin-dependent oxidoreductase n=1 Tax=Embleya sp. NPDC020630 TaxID=3363979 RepID=UPI0037915F58
MADGGEWPHVKANETRRWLRAGAGALGGLLSAGAALAVAEFTAAFIRPEAGPLPAVGGAVIDRTPPAVKDWAVRHFGTDDKLVLQTGILVILGLIAMGLGVLSLRLRRTAMVGVFAFGLVGAYAAVHRAGAGLVDTVPSLLGGVLGAAALWWSTEPVVRVRAEDRAFDRRAFLITAGALALGSAVAGTTGRIVTNGRRASIAAFRDRIRLPAAAEPAAPLPPGSDLRLPGLSAFTTPNADFYRVDTALVVPRVDVENWSLRIHGKGVRTPLRYSYDDLLRRPLIERDLTLTCVSNEVGGPYTGTARWLGIRLVDLLREAGVRPPSRGGPADQLVSRSIDGMTIGTPVEVAMDGRDALLAVGMNGEPLPFEHGYPVRMVVPGLYGYVSACKWLVDLELTTFAGYDAYWVKRTWAREAPIKTQSRIDTPKPFARLRVGVPVPIAGVAWAQHRGVAGVEVSVDGGPWQPARSAEVPGPDTWRQWVWEWTPTRTGSQRIEVRATDATGAVQTDKRVGTVPDGATGRHSVVVTVA